MAAQRPSLSDSSSSCCGDGVHALVAATWHFSCPGQSSSSTAGSCRHAAMVVQWSWRRVLKLADAVATAAD